jgi:hypothetical protein
LRAAAEISLLTRAVYMIRCDPETRRRLGDEVSERERRAQGALDHLSAKLFGRDVSVEELLAENTCGGAPEDRDLHLHPPRKDDHEAAANGPVGKVGSAGARHPV